MADDQARSMAAGGKTPIAVFDFDGTVLDGQSSVALVLQLIRRHLMTVSEALPVAWWGVRYKLHLPHEQYEVRTRVFKRLAELDVAEVERLCDELYDKCLVPSMRSQAVELIERYQRFGVRVCIVSASFEPIIARVARGLGTDQVSTRMEVKDGRYTSRLAAPPVEGVEKVRQLALHENQACGVGGWRVVAAYGDHHTDAPLLKTADHAFAVDPDWLLTRTARRQGWPVLRWRDHVAPGQLDDLLAASPQGVQTGR